MAPPRDARGFLDWAEDYARMGLPIIPLRGKVPAVRNWRRYAMTPEILRLWFGTRRCNIGLRTGESGYVVVDADTPEAEEWVRDHLPESPMQALSGGGSRHRYFRSPPDGEIGNRQGWNRIQGLDVRGHGGFIVLPPSVHPETGRRYEWLTTFSLPEGLPAFSRDWICERKDPVRVAVACVRDPDRLLSRGRTYVEKIDPAVSGAGGHTATFVAALKIVTFAGFNPELAWHLLRHYNATRCLPAWNERALRHKLDDALRLARH